jgi:hypothetical protein
MPPLPQSIASFGVLQRRNVQKHRRVVEQDPCALGWSVFVYGQIFRVEFQKPLVRKRCVAIL